MKKAKVIINEDGVASDGKSEGWYSYMENDGAYFRRDNRVYSETMDGGRGFPVHDVWWADKGIWTPYEGERTKVAMEGSYVTRAEAESSK